MTGTVRARQPRLGADVRREQALDAALAIIVRDGYAAVNMEAVAREMDVAKPVVYSAWGDLQSLLVALLDREETRAFTQLAEALPASADGARLPRRGLDRPARADRARSPGHLAADAASG